MNPPDFLDLYADAEFYDAEFATRDLELPFFRRHAQAAHGPVLEVACGTGRLTLPIARDGVDITGLDISRPMLERARQKSTAAVLDVEWLEQDCRTMRLDRKFSLIFSATNAMQHLLDLDSASAFLLSARKLLRPGGHLLLDVFNPAPAKLVRPITTRYVHKQFALSTGELIRVEVASEYQAATQILRFDLFYLHGEELLRTKHVNMRCFFPEELLALLRFSGFTVLHRWGDYHEALFISTSPKQLLLCTAAG